MTSWLFHVKSTLKACHLLKHTYSTHPQNAEFKFIDDDLPYLCNLRKNMTEPTLPTYFQNSSLCILKVKTKIR